MLFRGEAEIDGPHPPGADAVLQAVRADLAGVVLQQRCEHPSPHSTDLAGTDLAGTDLAGTDLAGTDLAGVVRAPTRSGGCERKGMSLTAVKQTAR
ncbi:pentapeptide repeat-containing protein [Frankia sp. CpI1-P]|uniref:pentapeptide repeat-containing protein n=1 Tax=Frankia sp. CpI1-P TaxID=1502734 RepID=UPI000FF8AF76